jgi:hypothetical protein
MKKISIMTDMYHKTLNHHHPGQSLVEFALVLPLFVLLIAGIFDIGRAFYSSITITNATREGARYGTLNPDYAPGMCRVAYNEVIESGLIKPNIDFNWSDISISCNITVTCIDPTLGTTPSPGCTHHQPLMVTVNYLYDDMILGFFIPSGINMERYTEMLVP